MKKNLKFLLVLSSLNCIAPQAESSAVYEMCEEVIKNNLSYSFNMTVDYLNEHNISNTIPIAVGPNLQEYCNEIIKNSTYYVRLVNTFLPSYTLDNAPNAAEWGTFGVTVVGVGITLASVVAGGVTAYYVAKEYNVSKDESKKLNDKVDKFPNEISKLKEKIYDLEERVNTNTLDNMTYKTNIDEINNHITEVKKRLKKIDK